MSKKTKTTIARKKAKSVEPVTPPTDVPLPNGDAEKHLSEPMKAGLEAVKERPKAPKKHSKLALLIELLSREEGASLDDITTATGWQKHTARSAISRALVKERGYKVLSEKSTDGKRVYKIIKQNS